MKKSIFPLSVVAAAVCSQAVAAQNIDYGSLEMLFEESVTTSATGKPQRASEAPVTMEILTAEDIRKSGVREIPDVLRLLPGLDVIQRSQSQFDVSVRGYNQTFNPRMLVLINGRQVYLDHFGYVAWNSLPVQIEEIRQIEVVKGPNTALFGFNAAVGVINIVTYNPLFDDESTVTAGVGTNDEIFLSSVNTFKLGDKGGMRLSIGYEEREAFDGSQALYDDLLGDGIFQDTEDQFNVMGDLRYQITPDLAVGLEGTYSLSNINERQVTFTFGRAEYETYSVKGDVTYNAGSLGTINFSAYRNWLENVAGQIPLDFKNEITVLKLEDIVKVGAKHTLRLAAEYRNSVTDQFPNFELDQVNEATVEVFALSGMWDYAISDKLSLTTSARLDMADVSVDGFIITDALPGWGFDRDDYDQSYEEFSLNAGAVYRATAVDTFRLAVARGISFPSAQDFGVSLVSTAFNGALPFALGAEPGLEATTIWNYELSYERALESIGGALSVNLFYQQQDDIRTFAGGFTFTPRIGRVLSGVSNIGDSEMFGAEIALDGKMGNFDWQINYTYLDIDDDLPPPGILPVSGLSGAAATEFEQTVANHRINAKIGYTSGDFYGEIRAFYANETQQLIGSLGLSALVPVDDYIRLDASARYKIDDTYSLQLTVQRALDDSFVEQPIGVVERQARISLRATF